MIIKIVKIIGWATILVAPISLIAGHLGDHNLSWAKNHISTFAAQAPNDYLITFAMIMSAISLVCIGILLSLHSQFKSSILNQICSMLFGASAAGLVLLSRYEETATTIHQLKKLGFNAIRIQSFHDAGLLIFFYSAIFALIVSGFTILIQYRSLRGYISGIFVFLIGPLSFFLMVAPWTKYIGLDGNYSGIKQRGAFLCLWVGALIILSFKGGVKTKYVN